MSATLQRKTPLRKKAVKRKPKPRVCDWSSRCTRRAPVIVSETERYCRGHARKVADELHRQIILNRDWWTCQVCSRSPNDASELQRAHVISRGARYIEYLDENLLALCAGCHLEMTLKPAKWSVWLATNRPGLHDRLALLEAAGERSHATVDLAQLIRNFRAGVAA